MRKLATAAFSFAAAILISHYLLPIAWLPFIAAAAAATSLIGLLFRADVRYRILIILLSLAFGFIWRWTYVGRYIAPAARLHGTTATVTATILGYPAPSARGYRIDCAISLDKGPALGARLYYYGEAHLEPGDIIEFAAQFMRTDGSDNTERIDALSSRGAFLTGYISGEISKQSSQAKLRYFPQRLANSVAHMIDRLYGDDVSPFMQALLVGKRDKLNSDTALNTALSASGISHVVAISGMHVSFLMSFLATIIKKKRLFAFVGIPALFFFMAMTGFTASVARAGIMQVFLICAPMFRRENDSLTSLSAALFVLLLANPYSIASVSLQLSFAATLGIILFTGNIHSAIAENLHESKVIKNSAAKAILSFAATSLATTIGALVFTLPLTAVHFGLVSLIAPLTNLATLWAVAIAFPAGIISCIFAYIAFPIASFIAYPVAAVIRYVIFVARSCAALPFSAVYSSNILFMFWLAYVYVMFIALPMLRARIRQYILPCCLAIVLLCATFLLSPLLPGGNLDSITVLDVGQGQSIVFRSEEYVAVIDCGSSSGEDAGFIAHEYLSNQGIAAIDVLILTHFHSDHVNGVEHLMSRIDVAALCIPDPDGSYLADDIIQLARRRGTDIIYVMESIRVSLGLIDLILYPPLGYGDENERGLSILALGNVSALITGDMNSSGERTLLRFALLPDIDLLVVGHHGSRFSTSEELLAAVTPEIAVISVGKNSYGHPASETIERLEQFVESILRTDQMGHVTVTGK